MKLLLTSGGIQNPSINDALVDMLGKPIAECQRSRHPHRELRAPPDRSRAGLEVRQRTRTPVSDDRGGVEVRRACSS